MAFGRRFKKAMRKVGRGLKRGATAVHNVTHKGPIGEARKAVAGVVKKIPVAKQFVEVGEFSSGMIHKGLKKTGVLGKNAAEPMKRKNTKALLKQAGKLSGETQKLTLVAMAASPVVSKAMRRAGALTKSPLAMKRAAKSAARKLARAAKKGSKSARKGLALAAAASQVAKGKHATARKTVRAGGGKKVTYEVRNLATGKVTRVSL